MFTDTHCHFEKQYYDNYNEVFQNAFNNNVSRFIACGCSKDANAEAVNLSNNNDFVYTTIGFHPDQANFYTDKDLEELKKLIITNKKVIGIGEIGLDYHYDGYDKGKQITLFEKQLKIAEELKLPVVIHSRDATQDTIDILKKYNVKGVIHSFSGSFEVAKIYISMGFKLGVNGVVTFKNSNLSDTLSKLDISNLVLETDSPYLTPEPFRGQKNESKNILYIAKKIAEIYNIELEKVSEITNKNIKEIFDI